MKALSMGLLRPLACAVMASLVVVVLDHTTDLGASLAGTAVLGALLLLAYVVLLLGLIGLPKSDREAFALALGINRGGKV
jgi:hypothetical protein